MAHQAAHDVTDAAKDALHKAETVVEEAKAEVQEFVESHAGGKPASTATGKK